MVCPIQATEDRKGNENGESRNGRKANKMRYMVIAAVPQYKIPEEMIPCKVLD